MLPSGAMQGRKPEPFVGVLTGFFCLLKGFKVTKVDQFLIDLDARKPLSLAAMIAHPNGTARVVYWQLSVHRILLITYFAQVIRAIVHFILIDVVNISLGPAATRKRKRYAVRFKECPFNSAAKVAGRVHSAKGWLVRMLRVPSCMRSFVAEKLATTRFPRKQASFFIKGNQLLQPIYVDFPVFHR